MPATNRIQRSAPSAELGHPSYQHPQRIADGIYHAEVDRFSHLAICTAIRCVMAGGRDLWNAFDNGDNLLFRETDFQSPETSELFHRLWAIPNPESRGLVGRLVLACKSTFDKVPLLEETLDDGTIRPLSADEHRQVEAVFGTGTLPTAAVPQFAFPSPDRTPPGRYRPCRRPPGIVRGASEACR